MWRQEIVALHTLYAFIALVFVILLVPSRRSFTRAPEAATVLYFSLGALLAAVDQRVSRTS